MYSNEGCQELLLFYVNKYVDDIKGNKNKSIDDSLEKISKKLIISLFVLAPMLKHESFKEEKEWRIVCSNLNLSVINGIKFRYNESTIIPYIEFSMCTSEEELNFERIIIGPVSIDHFTKDAVGNLLESKSANRDIITLSNVPYRIS